MPLPKPPPRNFALEEERKVQMFLERAAQIIFQDPALTAQRWRELAVVAAELELSAERFRSTLDELIQRGVLRPTDELPPKPPPLPGRESTTLDKSSSGLMQEVGFALSPPPSVARPPVEKKEGAESDIERILNSTSSAKQTEGLFNPAPAKFSWMPPLPGESPGTAHSTNRSVPANLPTEPPPSKDAGARPGLERSKSDSSGGAAITPERVVGRWRIEGEPVPVLPRPAKKPHETYLDFVRQSLAYIDDGIVGEELEQRLMNHGTRVLWLSPVYARHLLDQVVAEKNVSLASASTPAAILAEPVAENNSNPSSRPLDHTAKAVLDHGIETNATVDRVQQERLLPFREYVQSSLDRVRGTLLLPLFEKMSTAGCDLYGLKAALVERTIRNVASDLKIVVVTRQEAEKSLTGIVAQTLGDDLSLSAEDRDRVRQAGAQWGLTVTRIDELVDEVTQTHRAARRREDTTTRLALIAASLAVLFVICFLGYAFLGGRSQHEVHESLPKNGPVTPQSASSPNSPTDDEQAESKSDSGQSNARADE